MPWLEVNLEVGQSETDQASAALESADALAVTLQNPGEGEILEPGVGETPFWLRVRVTGLFAAEVDQQQLLLQLLSLGIVERPDQMLFSELADQQWERSWMDRFEPMQFGSRLWIYPSTVEPPDNDDIILRLDPGLAFGTGTHPTTALCLAWLDSAALTGRTVVDYGCGSGILAIAAALLGAGKVIAVDNDPQALSATRENAARNNVGGKIETLAPEVFDCRNADVVLANILSRPLIDLAPLLTGCLVNDGNIVLSGILEDQAGSVQVAYSNAIQWHETNIQQGWVCLFGTKS
jgi:ribosomal protein L11 methyltransferase